MKKLLIVIIALLITKSIYNYKNLEYNSKTTIYRSIPFYGIFYKMLGYKVLSYNCIDVIYFNNQKVRNTSGYLGVCNIDKINEDIKTLEEEEYFFLRNSKK